MNLRTIISTSNSKIPPIARLIAGAPLLLIGIQHLIGAAPMEPILVGAGIPLPELNATIAPIFEIIAGILLLSGAFARVGGLIAVGAMAMAIYSHVVFDWPTEPPMALPIVVLLAALFVIWKGAGAWSVDRKRTV